MGLEAYRVAVKSNYDTTTETIKNALYKLGGVFVTEDKWDSDTYIDYKTKNGYIEFQLVDTEKNIFLNKEKNKYKCKIYLQFSKPSAIEIVDDLMKILSELKDEIQINGIMDLKTGDLLDVNNYGKFKEDVQKDKSDFDRMFPGIDYPIKCKDVFPTYRHNSELKEKNK